MHTYTTSQHRDRTSEGIECSDTAKIKSFVWFITGNLLTAKSLIIHHQLLSDYKPSTDLVRFKNGALGHIAKFDTLLVN